jgi:Replication-relaxation
MLTDRQQTILRALARHYTLTASQVRRLIFRPEQDRDGRITRRLLAALHAQHLLNKCRCEVVNPLYGLTCPVYYPSRQGCELLAVLSGDDRYHLTPTQTPAWQNLRHWVCLSDLRMVLDPAIERQSTVVMPAFFNEFDVVNKDAVEPAERFRLYTLIEREPKKLCCVPDAAFLLRVQSMARAFYVELEMGSNPAQKAAAEKTPGYAALAGKSLFRRHFADAADFRVLCFAPDATWRDALRRAFRTKEGMALWKFAALTDVKPETVLHAPIFFPAGDGAATPLVKGAAA